MKSKTLTVAGIALALLISCAKGGDLDAGSNMARLYPLGQAPPQDSVEIRFVRVLSVDQLAPRYAANAMERAGTLDTSLANEIYAYDASWPRGVGQGMHINRRCDYVLVDSERRVIGAFRVQELC